MTKPIPSDHPKLAAMRDAVKRAREFWESKAFESARILLDPVAAELAALELSSPQLDWALGVTLDQLDHEEDAMAHLERALAADPLFVEAASSIRVVLSNARSSLAIGDLLDDSPRVAMLYRVLQRKDAADRNAHVVFARHQIARGELAEARSLLDAMSRLYYPAPDIYELLAVCAERLGDTAAALRARGELKRLSNLPSTDASPAALRCAEERKARRPAGPPS